MIQIELSSNTTKNILHSYGMKVDKCLNCRQPGQFLNKYVINKCIIFHTRDIIDGRVHNFHIELPEDKVLFIKPFLTNKEKCELEITLRN